MLRRQVLQSFALGAAALACQKPESAAPARDVARGTSSSRSARSGRTVPATHHDVRTTYPALGPLGDDVFTRRRDRARDLAKQAGATLVFAGCGGASFAYLVGADFFRSERLIAFVLPVVGEPFLVAPSFEVLRLQQSARALRVVGWDESDDPYRVLARELGDARARGGVLVDPKAEYGTVAALARAMPEVTVMNGAPLFDALRVSKTPEEILRMRRAIEITEDSIASTFDQLELGMRDSDIARIIKDEHKKRDVDGDALVQLGPDSALPHGGPSGRVLTAGMVVLIDGGCTFQGYWSDISRTRWFVGDDGLAPSARFREIYRTVHDAQTVAMARVRPGVAAQEIDRAAREVIARAGYGARFTHRLGHGIGMDGHEAAYMVEGNTRALEPGFVFSVEPGIYLPNEFGIRLEDDFMCTPSGGELLSRRAPRV